MCDIANTYSSLGRTKEALEINQKNLERNCRVLPECHPHIGEGDALYRHVLHSTCDILCDIQASP